MITDNESYFLFLQLRISMYSHLMAVFILKLSRTFLWKQSQSLPFPQIWHIFFPPKPVFATCLI